MMIAKCILLSLLIVLSCKSKEDRITKDSDFSKPIQSDMESQEELECESMILISETPAKYKHGGAQALMEILYTSISSISLSAGDIDYTTGIYQMKVDTNGITSNFIVIRSITKSIDDQIATVCDTLEFYPGSSRGQKVENQLTLPISINFEL